ncbi:MAG TPA: ABC transporter ATP-binding protein [Rhodocyclaceae bacterium]|nr:ABC transporter ATP-binding protein [Rhodocyclaceae bacterium]
MDAGNALLIARRLAFSHGPHAIFADVDFAIWQREIVCLIGASGCGKTTLLRVLAGLTEPSAGEVIVDGHTDASRAAKAGVVFQSPALLPWLTVEENVAFGLDFSCRPKESKAQRHQRVARTLAQVGLAEHGNKKPHALSGGMAQRTALARALARDPEVVYLDEPFSALDAVTRESMQDLLVDLVHQHQSAALLVTHDIDEALRIGDRVVLLGRRDGNSPAAIVGEWRPGGKAPRTHRSNALNAMREEILNHLSEPAAAWFPHL